MLIKTLVLWVQIQVVQSAIQLIVVVYIHLKVRLEEFQDTGRYYMPLLMIVLGHWEIALMIFIIYLVFTMYV